MDKLVYKFIAVIYRTNENEKTDIIKSEKIFECNNPIEARDRAISYYDDFEEILIEAEELRLEKFYTSDELLDEKPIKYSAVDMGLFLVINNEEEDKIPLTIRGEDKEDFIDQLDGLQLEYYFYQHNKFKTKDKPMKINVPVDELNEETFCILDGKLLDAEYLCDSAVFL
ncbi:MAG: hypothetical protein ACEPO8_15005 [Rhodothermaceae bacterium]